MEADQIKKIVAQKAVERVYSGMKLGIGSGTTVFAFLEALAPKIASGLKIEAICASSASEELALKFNIPINHNLTLCDLYIDGSDEIDQFKNCLKGKGKALFREKIIATMSREVLIMIDESKKSQTLHKAPLVCEILPFGYLATIRHIEQLGFSGHLRVNEEKKPIITDNKGYLFDIKLKSPLLDPRAVHNSLKHIPGVCETGVFFDIVTTVIVGYGDGQVLVY